MSVLPIEASARIPSITSRQPDVNTKLERNNTNAATNAISSTSGNAPSSQTPIAGVADWLRTGLITLVMSEHSSKLPNPIKNAVRNSPIKYPLRPNGRASTT